MRKIYIKSVLKSMLRKTIAGKADSNSAQGICLPVFQPALLLPLSLLYEPQVKKICSENHVSNENLKTTVESENEHSYTFSHRSNSGILVFSFSMHVLFSNQYQGN